eukprot:CAMPEP_0177631972 /NCGR_PEP_ID=MMETSP0447-20121125/2036_1 /TAXON_ID=0 /ORGANISM="Stygamoeba regulata, Strain BSH-02190019" /LENGTH=3482 /DNA_ID=CAMNT_0019133495 /DNA_START=30 /DNA_END=10479 /DNA_ORIENTATION=-
MRAATVVALLLLLLAVAQATFDMKMKVLIISKTPKDPTNFAYIVEALGAPNIPYDEFNANCVNNDCAADWASFIGTTVYMGVIFNDVVDIYNTGPEQNFVFAFQDYVSLHNIRVVYPYRSPIASAVDANIATSYYPLQHVIDTSVYEQYGGRVEAGLMQGLPCGDGWVNGVACVPGQQNAQTVKFTPEAHGVVCGDYAGSSGLQCDLQMTSEAVYYFPVILNPGGWWAGLNGKFTPFIVHTADPELDHFTSTTSTNFTGNPQDIVLAGEWQWTLYGKNIKQLEFYCSQGTWSRMSKIFSYVWIHYLTSNIYMGQRRVYLTPQIDDTLMTTKFRDELTAVFLEKGTFPLDWSQYHGAKKWPFRISPEDLSDLIEWQRRFRDTLPKGSDFQIELGFNGQSTPVRAWNAMSDAFLGKVAASSNTPDRKNPFHPDNYFYDDLYHYVLRGTTQYQTLPLLEFFWVSHTWAHLSLTCNDFPDVIFEGYPVDPARSDWGGPYYYNNRQNTSDPTNPTGPLLMYPTRVQEVDEALQKNIQFFNRLFSIVEQQAEKEVFASFHGMIPPKISGLYNPNALSSELANGITSVVGDNTRNGINPTVVSHRPEWEPDYWCIDNPAEPQTDVAVIYNQPDILTPSVPWHGVWTTDSFNRYAGQFIIPRWANEIYFDASTLDENIFMYNDVVYKNYGADAITANEMLNREAHRVTNNLINLRHDAYMFHQANLRFWWYDQVSASGQDLMDLTVPIIKRGIPWINNGGDAQFTCLMCVWSMYVHREFSSIFIFPLATLRQDDLKVSTQNRMALDLQCDITSVGKTITVNGGGDDVEMLYQVDLTANAKGTAATSTTCVVVFTGSEAAMKHTAASPGRFPAAILDPASLRPDRHAGSNPIYRTVFGPERSFYVVMTANGDTESVTLSTPRFLNTPASYSTSIELRDATTNAPFTNALEPLSGGRTIRVVNLDSTRPALVSFSASATLAEGWNLSPPTTDPAANWIAIQSGASADFVLTRTKSVGEFQARISFSCGDKLYDLQFSDVVVSAAFKVSAIGVTLPALGTFAANVGGVVQLTISSNTTQNNIRVTHQLKPEQTTALSLSLSATSGTSVSLTVRVTGSIHGDFSTNLVVQSDTDYQLIPVTWTTRPPYTPLSIVGHLRIKMLDLGFVPIGQSVTDSFLVENNDSQPITVYVDFGGQQIYGPKFSGLMKRKKRENYEFATCITDQPTFTVWPTQAEIPANSSIKFDVSAFASASVNLTCGNTFYDTLSVWNPANPDQENLIMDVMLGVSPATDPIISASTVCTTTTTVGDTTTCTFSFTVSDQGATFTACDATGSNIATASDTIIIYEVAQDGSLVQIGTCPSAKKRGPQNPVQLTSKREYRAEVKMTGKQAGESTSNVIINTDVQTQTQITCTVVTTVQEPENRCSVFEDSSTDGTGLTSVGGKYELLGIGVCDDCNKIRLVVAGLMNLTYGETFEDKVITNGDTIFNFYPVCRSWDSGAMQDSFKVCRGTPQTIKVGESVLYEFEHDTQPTSPSGGAKIKASLEIQLTAALSGHFTVTTIRRDSTQSFCGKSCVTMFAFQTPAVTFTSVNPVPSGSYPFTPLTTNNKFLGYNEFAWCMSKDNRCSGGAVDDTCMVPVSTDTATLVASGQTNELTIACPVMKFQTCDGSFEIAGCPITPLRSADQSSVIGVRWFSGSGEDTNVPVGVHANVVPMSVQSTNYGYSTYERYAKSVDHFGGSMGLFNVPLMYGSYFRNSPNDHFTTVNVIKQGTLLAGYPVTDVTANYPDLHAWNSKFPSTWTGNNYRVFEFDRRAFPSGAVPFFATQALECGNDVAGVRGYLQKECSQPPPNCQNACCRATAKVVSIGLCAGSGNEACLYSLPSLASVAAFNLESPPGNRFSANTISAVAAHPRTGVLYLFERKVTTDGQLGFTFYVMNSPSDPMPASQVVISSITQSVNSAELLDAAFDPCDLRLWVSVRNVGLLSFDPASIATPAVFERNHIDETPEWRWTAIAFVKAGRALAGLQKNGDSAASTLFFLDLKGSPVAEKQICTGVDLPSDLPAVQYSNTEDDILLMWALKQDASSADIVTVYRLKIADSCSLTEWKKLNDGESAVTGIAGITLVAPCTTCVPQPPECARTEYLDTATNTCKKCDTSCFRCSGDSKTCTECARGKYLLNGECKYCSMPCQECTSPTTCTSCLPGNALESGVCTPCDKSCALCAVDSATTCTACKKGSYLSGTSCMPCSVNCLSCDEDPEYCTKCFADWSLVSDGQRQFCVHDCPPGTHRGETDQTLSGSCVCDNPDEKFDKKSQTCVSVNVFQVCGGMRFATLDGSIPSDTSYTSQQDIFLPLPTSGTNGRSTWQLVPDDIRYRECLSCHNWGSVCLVFANGNAYQTNGDACGINMLITNTTVTPPQYKPANPNFRVVMMKSDADTAFTRPPLLSQGGWTDYKGGYAWRDDPTDTANKEGMLVMLPDDTHEAGATWAFGNVPENLRRGFNLCAESVMLYDDKEVYDPAAIEIPNRSLHRYSINVDVFYTSSLSVDTSTVQYSSGSSTTTKPFAAQGGICPEYGFFSAFPKDIHKKSDINVDSWNRRCVSVRPANPNNIDSIYVTLLFDPCDASAKNIPGFDPYADCKGTHLVQAWFRKVTLEKLDENVLGNPSFEHADYQDTGFGGGVWRKFSDTGYVSIDNNMAHTGTKSVRISFLNDNTKEAGYQQIYFFDDPTRHTQTIANCQPFLGLALGDRPKWPRSFYISGWSKASNVDGESSNTYSLYVDMRLKNKDSDEWSYGHFIPFSTGTHDWEFVEHIVYAPEEVAAIYVTLLFKDHTGEVWFDDIRVTPRDYECTWEPPEKGDCYGDPHILTHDLQAYDMMVQGEYLLTQAGPLEVQVRTTKVQPAASVNIGVAVKYGNPRVKRLSIVGRPNSDTSGAYSELWPHVTLFFDKGVVKHIDVPMADTDNFVAGFGDGVYIVQHRRTSDTRTFSFIDRPNSYTVNIEVRKTDLTQYLRVYVKYPDSERTKVSGLLGDWDGNPANDFRKRDGTQLDVATTLSDLHTLDRVFIDSWRITSMAESGFFYNANETPDYFYDPAWPTNAPSFTTAEIDAAKLQCASQNLNAVLLDACMYDVLTIGNSVVVSYKDIQQTNTQLPSSIDINCKSTCASCQKGDGTACATCAPGMYLLENKECVSSCGAGLFGDDTDKTCKPCTPPCVTCRDTASNCLSCTAPKMLIAAGGMCVDACPSNQAVMVKDNIKICTPCDTTCRTCADSSKNGCTSCWSPGSYLFRSVCLSDCPTGYWAESSFAPDGFEFSACVACSEADFGYRPECPPLCPAGQVPYANLASCFTPGLPPPPEGNTGKWITTSDTLVYLTPYDMLPFPITPADLTTGVVEAVLTVEFEITGVDAAAFVRLGKVGAKVVPDLQPQLAYSRVTYTLTITVDAPNSSELLPKILLLVEWISGTKTSHTFKYRHWWGLAYEGPERDGFTFDMGEVERRVGA